MQTEAIGRLPTDMAHGSQAPKPSPEYIEQAAEPSDDAWAREQELYRRKQEETKPGS